MFAEEFMDTRGDGGGGRRGTLYTNRNRIMGPVPTHRGSKLKAEGSTQQQTDSTKQAGG
jgi:hypothetical protein